MKQKILRAPDVEKARDYAIIHHGIQKFGEQPYHFHLDMVYSIAVKFNLGADYEIAAYLHDLIEDTSITKEVLEEKFGGKIANMVFCVSGEGNNRKEKQASIYKKLDGNVESINLKMCDRLANLLASKLDNPSLFNRYQKEHELFSLDLLFAQGNGDLHTAIKTIFENEIIKKNKPSL